jgi:predicted RNA binding protein YcfA (HicA-like mRNA interferase family)
MPKLIPISHRELARKLKSAGYIAIRTSRHPVYYLAAKNLTIPVPQHPGDVPKGTLRAIVREMGIGVEEFNKL